MQWIALEYRNSKGNQSQDHHNELPHLWLFFFNQILFFSQVCACAASCFISSSHLRSSLARVLSLPPPSTVSYLIKFKPLCFSGFPPPHIVTWKQTCSRTKTRKHLITSFVPPHNKIRCLMKSHTVEGGCLARGYTIALFFILASY